MFGTIIERRDQVLIGLRSFLSCAARAFFRSWASTKGPFLTERGTAITSPFPYLRPRRRTIMPSVRLFLRVLYPLVGTPHGVVGWTPKFRPSPPPCGWSTGFITVPRTCGRRPSQRLRPALPRRTLPCSVLPTRPIVARQRLGTRRTSPLGREI